jgi:putative ABC transport system permease protein
MNSLKLAIRLLGRDLRAGELTLLALALLIAVSSSTTITLFADRMSRTMTSQAAEFMAGDLAVSGSAPLDDKNLALATQLGLAQAQTTEFSSVLLENNEMLLASVKAVSSAYPLRGALKTVDADYANETRVTQGPPPGEAWVEMRVLTALKLKLGDTFTVGEKPLILGRVLSYEPDKRSNFYNFSPRVMINQADLAATAVVKPGSRVHYEFQFVGQEGALTSFKQQIKPLLLPSQRLMDIHEDRPELGSALNRAEQYLGLSSIVVVLIAGVAIAMSTQRYTERHFNTVALLRCLGSSQRTIVKIFGWQILLLGVFMSAGGSLIGWVVQEGLFYILKSLLPPQLAAPSFLAYVFGFSTGLAILFGFALPPVLRLRNVSALRVLRRDLEPLTSSAYLIYGLALLVVGSLIWRYTLNLSMTGIILGVGVLVLWGVSIAINSLLSQSSKLLPYLGLSWRFGLQGLLRNRSASVSQILAFSITLAAMTLSFVVRNDLLDNWQKQLPAEAPNHFALNIFPEQLADFQHYLDNAQISSSHFYPVVRGRLVAVNNAPVQERAKKDSQGEEATRRELSLTWADNLPEDNKITAGELWTVGQAGLVSVEQKLAESLHIQVGDELAFVVGSEQFQAKVANIRTVEWDTMRPNFYMIFSSGSLETFPTTYLTSFYVPPSQKSQLNAVLKKFPAVTILEVDLILQQFKTMLAQLTQAINLLLYFALLAGFSVLFAAVYATLDQRVYEGALLRTLGARVGFLRRMHMLEFVLLGGFAGIIATLVAEANLFALYKQVIHIDYHPSYYLWIAVPLCGIIGVSFAGFWGVRSVVKHAPLPILRRLQ